MAATSPGPPAGAAIKPRDGGASRGWNHWPPPQAGPHDRKDLSNSLATAGTGMLPEPGTSDQDDMAPGG
jgi:hypothetical protein